MKKALLVLGAVLLVVLPGACGDGGGSEEVVPGPLDISGQYQAVYETDSVECTISGVTETFPVGGQWNFTIAQDNTDLTLTMEAGLAYQGVILSGGDFAVTATAGGTYATGGVTTTVFITYVFSGTYQDDGIHGNITEKDVYQNAAMGDYQCYVDYKVWAVRDGVTPSI